MKKSERLNEMMIYLNNKSFFNLRDIMEKYQISKSTALRDIQSLEAIGMPIYSEHGRNGHYGILKNRLLSPIVFTIDEMYALYFAMLTLEGYQTTPFHLDLVKMKTKFESCISDEHINNLKRMKAIFSLASSEHPNSSPWLKDVLESAIYNKVSVIRYTKEGKVKKYIVQFFDISSSYGQWYATAYNHETKSMQVFRCDRIIELSLEIEIAPISIEDVKASTTNIYKNVNATDFEVFITEKGVDLYFKENYPSMSLHYRDGKPFIKGFYNQGEENFIAKYFYSYGQEIVSIFPNTLKELVVKCLSKNFDYYSTI